MNPRTRRLRRHRRNARKTDLIVTARFEYAASAFVIRAYRIRKQTTIPKAERESKSRDLRRRLNAAMSRYHRACASYNATQRT